MHRIVLAATVRETPGARAKGAMMGMLLLPGPWLRSSNSHNGTETMP
jgi:hypothetical protein